MNRADEFWEMFHTGNYTIQRIANYFGISKQAVSKSLKDAGYKLPRWPNKGREIADLREADRLEALVKKSYSVDEISRLLNVPHQTIDNWLKFHRISKGLLIPRIGKTHHAFTKGWCLNVNGYVMANPHESGYLSFNPQWTYKHIAMHKAVLEMEVLQGIIPDGYLCHHIDFNKENNESSNLAFLTIGQHVSYHHKYRKASPSKKELLTKQLIALSNHNIASYKLEQHYDEA